MTARFEIEGGHPVAGRIRPSGNKNAALPLLAATLLTDEEVVLRNVPQIRDVAMLLEILESLGVTVTHREPGVVALCAGRVNGDEPDPDACRTIRASILLAGPLLARRGHVSLLPPAATSSAEDGSTPTFSPSRRSARRSTPISRVFRFGPAVA